MALSSARKQELAVMSLPSDKETIRRAIAFQQRAGLTGHEFSQAIGYSINSLHVYLGGHYGEALSEDHDGSRNTLNIRAALKEYMDLWEGAQPLTEHRAPHRTREFLAVQDCCQSALETGAAYVIDGPPGTQKTFSLRHAEQEINARGDGSRAIYIYARVNHTPLSFLREICNTTGVSGRGNIDQVLRKLRFFLGQGRILLAIDEAQHLGHDALEVLRQLLDLPPYFGVVMGGSFDLTQRLSHWQMEQWRSRLRDTLKLSGPTAEEARNILRSEIEPLCGTLSKEQVEETIGQCRVTGKRLQKSGDKLVTREFAYISARDLFFGIEDFRRLQQKAARTGRASAQKKESAA
jgi:type II secretory pathway predicted ATPase ExeA